MTFNQFFLILRARWWVVCSVFAACVIAVLVGSLISPKQYVATASVLVEPKPDPIAGAVNPDQLSVAYLATQVDIVTSGRVAERVVQLLQLDKIPQFQQEWQKKTKGQGDLIAWLAATLERRVRVSPAAGSNVIAISVKWPDARAAAALANAFAKAYVDTTIDLKVEPAKQYTGWFDQRSRDLRADLEAKQQRLSDFQKQSQITASDERLDIENARLSELSTQLTSIQAQLQDSQSRQQQIKGANETLPEVLQSPVIASLKASLALEEAKLKNISVNLGKNHPDYQTTEGEISSLRDRISQEIAKVAGSLGNVTQTNLQREHEIRSALEAQKARVLELKHQRDELTDLQNDVAAAQRNLDAVGDRLAQSSLESQVNQTNVVGLTAATEPILPSSPNIQLNLVLGLLLGAGLGIGVALLWEMTDRRIRSHKEVTDLLSVPLLGRVASAKRWMNNKVDSPSAPTPSATS